MIELSLLTARRNRHITKRSDRRAAADNLSARRRCHVGLLNYFVAFFHFFFNDYTPLLMRSCLCRLIRRTSLNFSPRRYCTVHCVFFTIKINIKAKNEKPSHFPEINYDFNSSGQLMYVCNQHTIMLFSLLQSPRGEVYSHHGYSICSRLRIIRKQRELINCCWYLNFESELQPSWFCSLLLLKACFL